MSQFKQLCKGGSQYTRPDNGNPDTLSLSTNGGVSSFGLHTYQYDLQHAHELEGDDETRIKNVRLNWIIKH